MCQRSTVVDAVAGHRRVVSRVLELLHIVSFILREDAAAEMSDAQRLRHGSRGFLTVAREQVYLNAHLFQLFECGAGGRFHAVGNVERGE